MLGSLAELFWASWQWAWWLITAVVAAAVDLVSHLHPIDVSRRWWVIVLVIGGVASLLRAFHRVRMERDHLLRKPVGTKHAASLQATLEAVRRSLLAKKSVTYSKTQEMVLMDAFRVHFSELVIPLQEWDEAIVRLKVAKIAVRSRLGAEAKQRGLMSPEFDAMQIIGAIEAVTLVRAEQGQLDIPLSYQWQGFRRYREDRDVLSPGSGSDGWIVVPHDPEESDEEWREGCNPLIQRVDALAIDCQGWPEPLECVEAWADLGRRQAVVMGALDLAAMREIIRADQHCPVCAVNAL